MGVQCNNTSLVAIVNVYIFYYLSNWTNILLKNFTLKNCLFGATNIVKK